MKKIILVVSDELFNSGKSWEEFKNKVETLFPKDKVESHFLHLRFNSRKVLLESIPAWPTVVIFDECPEVVIKKTHGLLLKKKRNIIFYSKNRNLESVINGVNRIKKIGEVSLHLTVI